MKGMKAAQETGKKVFARVERWPRWVRMPIGLLLIVGGVLGFLPVLGFWMIPLGLAVLAIDIPFAGRAYKWLKRQVLRFLRWFNKRRSKA